MSLERNTMDWDEEWQKIKEASYRYGVDSYFVGAIRKTENGGPGKEFGVLGVSAPTYDDQLRICIATIKHRLVQYSQNHQALFRYIAPNGDAIVIYHPAFIDWFATIWAPVDAGNDPDHLNRNWTNNCKYLYVHLIDADHQR